MKRFIVVIAFLAILAFTAGPLMADKGGKGGGGKGRRGGGHHGARNNGGKHKGHGNHGHRHRHSWGFGGMWGSPYYRPIMPYGYGPMYPAPIMPIMPYGPYGNGGGFYGGNGGGFFFNF